MIILNKGQSINDKEISFEKIEYKTVLIKDNNLYLINNHNTLEFIQNDNFEEPVLALNKYYYDYPLIGDKSLYKTYYSVSNNPNDFSLTFEIVPLKKAIEVLNDNMYDNPRNNEITKEMLEILNKLKENNIINF